MGGGIKGMIMECCGVVAWWRVVGGAGRVCDGAMIAAIVNIKEITNGHCSLDFPETVKNNDSSPFLIRFSSRFFV